MKIPPSISKAPPDFLKLNTLHDIEQYLKKLKSQIRSGSLSSQDIDFIPIFHSIQEIVNSENLRSIIMEFHNSSSLFSRKIEDIRKYISSIGGKEEFEKYVKSHSQDALNDVFQALYNPPFVIDDINIDPLMISFLQLANRKKLFTTIEFPDFDDVERNGTAEDFEGLIDDVHFERDIDKFETQLISSLPQSLTNVLKSATNDEDRYSYFVYCLYLIQRKKIVYDKSSKELRKFEKEEES
ncbi:MAG: hypothetical protein EU530_04820 [Promethearchaeota archaeon]|nr:MAG: hypothetical protein EU530_04820 [Candidatus Lokiarchaeota archaeon]